jgi:hypothetical protein
MEKIKFADIPAYKWELIEKKAKSLKKYGVAVELKNIYEKTGRVFNYETKTAIKYDEKCIEIELTFPETLEKGQWQFLGAKTRLDENNYLLFGENIPERYKNNDFTCEHCGSKRFRKSVVFIQNLENGEVKQIGKTCLNKYLSSTLKQFSSLLLTISEILEQISEGGREYSNNYIDKYISVDEFLYYAYIDICERGYIKPEYANGNVPSTRFSAYDNFEKDTKDYRKNGLTIEQKDIVKKCKNAYTNFVEQKGKSDFSDNVQKLLNQNYIDKKYTNMIVFVPTFYLNQLKFDTEKKARDEKRKQFNSTLKSEFLGAVKDKIKTNCTLINCKVQEYCYDGYNTTLSYSYTFIDDEGHLLKWRTQKSILFDIIKDCRIDLETYVKTRPRFNIAGTIKEHNEFKDRFYTILTRCKLELL